MKKQWNILTMAVAVALGVPMGGWAQPPSGNVWAWGSNQYGQLGNGTTADSTLPVRVLGLTNAIAVDGTSSSSVAVTADGNVFTWGSNAAGALGIGVTCDPTKAGTCYSSTPTQVVGAGGSGFLTGIKAVAAGLTSVGNGYVLALDNSGKVWAWGANDDGNLGSSACDPASCSSTTTPVQVTATTGAGFNDGVQAIAAGARGNSLAVDVYGKVWSWGTNLGDLTTNTSSVPAPVPALSPSGSNGTVYRVAANASADYALDLSGLVYAWGSGQYGELGFGNLTSSTKPVVVMDPSDSSGNLHLSHLGSSKNRDGLGTEADTTARTWGDNRWGGLGNGTICDPTAQTNCSSFTPVEVVGSGGSGFFTGGIAIAGGATYNLALTNSGGVWAWGAGPLGNGTTNQDSPVQVSNIGGAVAIGAAGDHGLAIVTPQGQSDLSLTMSCASNCTGPLTGSQICYNLTVANNGPAAAPNAGYTDSLPAALGGGVVSDFVSSLGVGGNHVFNVCATIQNNVQDLTNVVNAATAVSDNTDPNSSNNSASYAIVVRNPPPVLTCPAPITTFATSASGATVNYSLPTVADNTDPTLVTLSCTPAPKSTFPIGTTNVGCTGTDPGGATGSCNFGVTVTTANLDITLSVNSPTVKSGGTLTYTITVHNGGPGFAASPQVTDSLPQGAKVTSVQSGSFACDTSTPGVLTCKKPGMNYKEADTITLTVLITAPTGTILNDKVQVIAASFDPSTSNNTATVSAKVTGP